MDLLLFIYFFKYDSKTSVQDIVPLWLVSLLGFVHAIVL